MVVIDQAEVSDVQGIKRVLRETWIDTYGHFLSLHTIEKVTSVWHAPELLAAQVKNPDVLFRVAKDENGAVLGLITAHESDEDQITVDRLYVLPPFQRMGLGHKLLNETGRVYPHAKKLQLVVEAQNEKGVRFYQKQGFKEVGRRVEKIEGETLEVIQMEKSLA